jgi:hypothetical protein
MPMKEIKSTIKEKVHTSLENKLIRKMAKSLISTGMHSTMAYSYARDFAENFITETNEIECARLENAQYIRDVAVIDPDSQNVVDLDIFKSKDGIIFAVNSSQ